MKLRAVLEHTIGNLVEKLPRVRQRCARAMDGNGPGTHDLWLASPSWKSCPVALALPVAAYHAASIPNRISHVRSNESQTRRTHPGISLPRIHLRSEGTFHLRAFPQRILPLFALVCSFPFLFRNFHHCLSAQRYSELFSEIVITAVFLCENLRE